MARKRSENVACSGGFLRLEIPTEKSEIKEVEKYH